MPKDYQQLILQTSEETFRKSISSAEWVNICGAVRCIREWYEVQPHLPQNALDDDRIMRFYICNKRSVERTKEKIDNYLSARTSFAEFFENRDPWDAKISAAFECVDLAVFPKVTEGGHRITYIGYSDKKAPDDLDNVSFGKIIFMVAEFLAKYDTVPGNVMIYDMKNCKLGHVLNMNPAIVRKSLFLLQTCYGTPIKGIYFLNLPLYAQNMIQFFMSVLKKKLIERVHFCSTLEELHKGLKPQYLPIELGGSDFKIGECKANMLEALRSDYWMEWFKDAEKRKTDESKRINRNRNLLTDDLGMVGSFRMINID